MRNLESKQTNEFFHSRLTFLPSFLGFIAGNEAVSPNHLYDCRILYSATCILRCSQQPQKHQVKKVSRESKGKTYLLKYIVQRKVETSIRIGQTWGVSDSSVLA